MERVWQQRNTYKIFGGKPEVKSESVGYHENKVSRSYQRLSASQEGPTWKCVLFYSGRALFSLYYTGDGVICWFE